MKHIFPILVLLIVFASCSPPEPVEFPDPNLAAAVREELSLSPDEPIMDSQLRDLKDLMIIGKEIKDLTGLENAKGLTSLYLNNNQISDLSPIQIEKTGDFPLAIIKLTILPALELKTGYYNLSPILLQILYYLNSRNWRLRT